MYRSLAEIVEAEKMSGKSFWQVVLEDKGAGDYLQ